MVKITAITNHRIQTLIKLKDKRFRDLQEEYLVEGYHLVEEAIKKGVLKEVYITKESDEIEGIDNYLVTDEIAKKLSQTVTPQGIIGVVRIQLEHHYESNRYLIIDVIQDPGNLGTIIRTAVGFGIETIVLGKESVDVYNEKVIRATQGSIFYINIIKDEIEHAIYEIQKQKITIYATALKKSIPLQKVHPTNQYAIILGSEGRGVSESILMMADKIISIQTTEFLESLNVGVAAGIIMYDFYNKMKG